MKVKVATIKDRDRIQNFAKALAKESGLSEAEMMMSSWDQPWREESLDFYLSGGWSFLMEDGGEIKGYLLAQPLLFFRNYTQSLWIEWVSAKTAEHKEELLDVAYRWARSKHLQKVVLAKGTYATDKLNTVFPTLVDNTIFDISSTKLSEEQL